MDLPLSKRGDIEPPPGLPLKVEASTDQMPKPKIAYHTDVDVLNPGLIAEVACNPSQAPAKVSRSAQDWDSSTLVAVAEPDEGRPMVRFCVFCGMQVAPKLIAARFCVYCGKVHSGKVEQGALDSTHMALPQQLWPAYTVTAHQGLRASGSTAMLYQALATYMSCPTATLIPLPCSGRWLSAESWARCTSSVA
eukprot:CAMPEP_0179187208 /NCGR_PEP_ID=MMETSP0796-20121207/92888_1 /TAXON_ID=73915 /ORGANISM="Pyrodinium bahamense, Strain pbaha01" /LENGTH=192 /DNA_ID=CAMNT_0020891265 /DNA_START=89 /DNA_END=667 /DNA_ORIENTATION=-